MTDAPPASLPRLLDDATIYRAARSKTWIDPDYGDLLPAAFLLRRGETGLSVSYNCSVQWVLENVRLNPIHAVASANVGSVRQFGLDVIPDAPHHAEVEGIPSDNQERALQLAHQLAGLFRVEWKRPDQ